MKTRKTPASADVTSMSGHRRPLHLDEFAPSSSHVTFEPRLRARTNSSQTAETELIAVSEDEQLVAYDGSHRNRQPSVGLSHDVVSPAPGFSEGSKDCYEKVQSWRQDLKHLLPESHGSSCPSPSPSFESTTAVWLSASEKESVLLDDGAASEENHPMSGAGPSREVTTKSRFMQSLGPVDNNDVDLWRRSITNSDDTSQTQMPSPDDATAVEVEPQQTSVREASTPKLIIRKPRALRRIIGTVTRGTVHTSEG